MIDTTGATRPLPSLGWRLWLFYPIWQLFAHIALLPALLFFLHRSRREPLYRKHFRHRFGFGPVGPKGSVWVFATSIGETRAVSPLVRALLEAGHTITLTHSSPAGLTEGKKLFDDPRVTHSFVPFDLFWATAVFFARFRPAIALVVEGEFWPGHLMVANLTGTPILHLNGNLHENSLIRAKRFWGLRMDLLTRFNAILTKSEGHKSRYLRAGAEPDRVLIVGELKFDQWILPLQLEAGKALRASWALDRPVFLIASSVAEEEPALCEIVARVLSLEPRPKIVWAPRSPQRFGSVTDALLALDAHVVRRSDALDEHLAGDIGDDIDVLVADSIGEMNAWYQLADIVFVGATLADKGGHNISEPLALGRPVLVGPSIYGITFPAEIARDAGAIKIEPSAQALGDETIALIGTPGALNAFAARAATFASQHVGATERSMQIINDVLAETPAMPRNARAPRPALTLRRAAERDCDLIWEWRNAPEVRAASRQSKEIPLDQHRAWYAAQLQNPGRELLMAEVHGNPVGMVRLDKAADHGEINIIVATNARGQGLASPMLSTALAQADMKPPVWRAVVKPDNAASLALFQGLGFREVSSGDLVTFERAP
mgnify:CR=1 FL=1